MTDELEVTARMVVDSVDVQLGYWDRRLRCRFANSAYSRWYGKPSQQIVGMSLQALLGPLYEANELHIKAALAGKKQSFERTFQLPGGEFRSVLVTYYPHLVQGKVEGFFVHVTDVTRLKRLEQELQHAKEEAQRLATHDFLTGLPNRVLLMDRIASGMAHVRRNGGLLGLVAIDLDRFKSINDTHGHGAGDRVLQEVAARMRSVRRDPDTLARFGGDEFILIANQLTSSEAALRVVGRLREAVCRPLQLPESTLTPSLSCGIALFPISAGDETELMCRADAALYEAKRKGRGCDVLAPVLPASTQRSGTVEHRQAGIAPTILAGLLDLPGSA